MLVLDEATSALDADAEAEIFARLIPELGQTTVILIGHRIPTGLPIGHVVSLHSGGAVAAPADCSFHRD